MNVATQTALDRARRAAERDALKSSAGVDTDAPVKNEEVERIEFPDETAEELVQKPEVRLSASPAKRASKTDPREAMRQYERELAERRRESAPLKSLSGGAIPPQSLPRASVSEQHGETTVTRTRQGHVDEPPSTTVTRTAPEQRAGLPGFGRAKDHPSGPGPRVQVTGGRQ